MSFERVPCSKVFLPTDRTQTAQLFFSSEIGERASYTCWIAHPNSANGLGSENFAVDPHFCFPNLSLGSSFFSNFPLGFPESFTLLSLWFPPQDPKYPACSSVPPGFVQGAEGGGRGGDAEGGASAGGAVEADRGAPRRKAVTSLGSW